MVEFKPREDRAKVSSDRTFTLKPIFVKEVAMDAYKNLAELKGKVGLEGPIMKTAQIVWYYEQYDEKVLIGHIDAYIETLEIVAMTSLSGLNRDNIGKDDIDSARIKIPKELPADLTSRLSNDSLVLKPIYADKNPELPGTLISLYPSEEYDAGSLPNITIERENPGDDNIVRVSEHHANSVPTSEK